MSEKQQNIYIIATGGTINSKFYAPTEGRETKKNFDIARFEYKTAS